MYINTNIVLKYIGKIGTKTIIERKSYTHIRCIPKGRETL